MKFKGFMKIIEEMTSKHKYHKEEQAKRTRTSYNKEPLINRDNKLELASRDQVSESDFREGNFSDTRLYGESDKVDLIVECILPDQQSITEEIQELCGISENKSDNRVSASASFVEYFSLTSTE